jgi:ParB family transcriptional regulator, chromosome partitioning protein
VRRQPAGDFLIVAGERRWRAHGLLRAPTIRAEVVDIDDDVLADQAIIENLQRAGITPLEEARAFQARLDAGLTVDELCARIGVKQPQRVRNRLALLSLREVYQEALAKNVLSVSQALEFTRLQPTSQDRLYRAIRDGKCQTQEELRRVAAALLAEEQQVALFSRQRGPSDEERAAMGRIERMTDQIVCLLQQGFDGNEVVILRRIDPARAHVLSTKIELMERALRQLRLGLAPAKAG